MLKVAVCLAGQTRHIDYTIGYLRAHLLSLYDCDVFIHTWNYDNRIGKPYIEGQPHKGIVQTNYRDLVASYAPKASVFEKPLFSSRNPTLDHFIKMQLYSKKAVIELANTYADKNHIAYDAYVLTRTDLILLTNHLVRKSDSLECREWTSWRDDLYRPMINDQFYSGSREIITRAAIHTYYEHLKRGIWKTSNRFWFCEELLGYAMADCPRSQIDTKFSLCRTPECSK